MAFELPQLSYSYDALEPHIDTQTMTIHHTKHHQAYVDNLNKALEAYPDFYKKTIDEIVKNAHGLPSEIRQTVVNNGGGHFNHTFFWEILTPKKTKPEGEFKKALVETFGSVDAFKEQFTSRAMGVFGSGWAFLIMTPDKKLSLKRHSFQNTPLMQGNIPILGVDVWEHAYYLKYQNRKADYIAAWWNVVHWEQAEKNFSQALQT